MSFHSWLQNLRSALATARTQRHGRRRSSLRAATHPPKLEVLDDRCLPSFSPATSFPVGTSPQAVVTADFNNDGRLDLATSYAGDNAVSVLLGDGQGGFGAASQFAAGSAPGSLAVNDFNGDGTIDLAAANSDGVSVLLGTGDGTFQPPVNTPFWWGAHLLAPADFNADGKMDLAYTSVDPTEWDTGFVQVLLGDGLGGFALGEIEYGYSSTTAGLAVADVNADGRPDVVTTTYGYYDGFVSVLLGNGDGTLSYDVNSSNFPAGLYLTAVAVGDFTSDGVPDLVITGSAVGETAVLPGRGDGTFADPIHVPDSSTGQSLVAADFNGDGRLDVLTVGDGSDDHGPASLFLGDGSGTFGGAEEIDIGGWYPSSPATGDFNGDGRPDLAIGVAFDAYGTSSVSVMLNDDDWAPLTPALRIRDTTITEGNTGAAAATFTVTLSVASSQPVTVAYATGNGSATAGSDYRAASGTLTFAPGETTKTITVPVIGDRLGEPSETFVVNLSGATNATVAHSQGVGTIADDEPRVSISDVTMVEGRRNQTATFTVTLSVAYDQPVTMSYRTVNGTAKSGEDYIAQSGTLTFAPGETTKTITIAVMGDNKEANETFYLNLSGLGSNALFTKNRGLGTILNDD